VSKLPAHMATTLILFACLTAAALLAFWVGRVFFFLLKIAIVVALIYFVMTRAEVVKWKDSWRGKISPPAEML